MVDGDSRRFVCLISAMVIVTRCNGYPMLKEAGVPFAIYVPTSFPDRRGELWWLALEAVIARNDRIGLVINGRDRKIDCGTVAEKRTLYCRNLFVAPSCATKAEMRDIVHRLLRFTRSTSPRSAKSCAWIGTS